VWLVCRAVLQMNGATPLYIASEKGHVECVRALLGKGAAIDQAEVGCARSMALHCEGYSRGDPCQPCRMHVQLVGWLPSARWRVCTRGDPAHVSLDGVGSILMIGCGTRATEVVRPGMMRGLCVPYGVADDQHHASAYCQSEWARGVRAGAVGRGRGNQPGEGGLCKIDGSAQRGLSPRGSVGALWHACAAGGVVALRVAESLGKR
jgi:hypothetical protein